MMITDVIMPHMSGAKLAEQLRLERPGMKVLFVSGYAETTVLRHGAIDVTTRFLQNPSSLKCLGKKSGEGLIAPSPPPWVSFSPPCFSAFLDYSFPGPRLGFSVAYQR